ncbi:MAG: bifunctional ornithine acetyltransferase/N-acetylglutamate synthase, partial [Proteobacteria bacterium]|nr:bifunctional ornithine acetyltransferase/N-acetylglutamate synthase [Pseudomonadota bacterium]
MAVGEVFKGEVHPVAGVRLAAIESGIRYKNRLDLVLVEIEAGATVAGVFTQNAFCAAPVKVARKNLHDTDSRYFLINTGNANAGTGEQGALDALRCCQSVADIARVDIREVLPFSTGVIGERLPVEKIVAGIPLAF